jgi:hypothetical protein
VEIPLRENAGGRERAIEGRKSGVFELTAGDGGISAGGVSRGTETGGDDEGKEEVVATDTEDERRGREKEVTK